MRACFHGWLRLRRDRIGRAVRLALLMLMLARRRVPDRGLRRAHRPIEFLIRSTVKAL